MFVAKKFQRVKQELVMITNKKNTALGHTNDAMQKDENNVEVAMLIIKINVLNPCSITSLRAYSKEITKMINKID